MKNRDVWVLSLQYISLILFWPNPLLWFLHFRLNQVRELRCDESAISQTGMAPVKYSEFLVDCLEKQIKPEPLIIGKYFFKNKKSMMTRINHLLNFKESQMRHQKLFRFGLPLVLVLLMFVFSWRCSRSAALVEPTIPVEAEKNNFIPFDSPPRPMGGFKSIQENLKYPETARAAGIEGKVFVRVKIDEAGKVVGTQVVKSSGRDDLDKAATDAIRLTKWNPAQKNDQAVKVEISIPVVFRLGEEKIKSMPPPAPKDGN